MPLIRAAGDLYRYTYEQALAFRLVLFPCPSTGMHLPQPTSQREPCSLQEVRRRECCRRHLISLWLRGRFLGPVDRGDVSFLVDQVTTLSSCDVGLFHGAGPNDLISANPVMGSAAELPVANRRVHAYDLAVHTQRPIRGGQRCDDFFAAPTTALVGGGLVALADVEHALIELLRDELDERRSNAALLHHAPAMTAVISSRVSDCELTEKVPLCAWKSSW